MKMIQRTLKNAYTSCPQSWFHPFGGQGDGFSVSIWHWPNFYNSNCWSFNCFGSFTIGSCWGF